MLPVPRRHEDTERGDGPERHCHQPRSGPKQLSHPSQGESIYDDSSGPLFNIYSKVAEEEDNKMAELWQKDADGILIFTGLFSAAVAALLAVSVQDLRQDPQAITAFYLENIYRLLTDPNTTRSSIPSAVIKPPPFSPPTYDVWVNSLWFLSLVVSLTCALLATLLHQWARRYIRNTQPPRCSPEKRARMRAFFSNGVDELHLPWAVEALPTLVHLSLFLFFSGLLIFLFNTNHMVFNAVVGWIALFSTAYGCITLMPIFRHDSPYYAPLSASVWLLYASIRYIIFEVLSSFHRILSLQARGRFRESRDLYRGWILRGIEKAAEETAWEQASKIDLRILGWAIDALSEDDTVERFFEAIPRFFESNRVKDLNSDSLKTKYWDVINEFLGRTLLSNSVSESTKTRRLIICMNATNVMHGPDSVAKILYDIFQDGYGQVLQSIETGHTLARWCPSNKPEISAPTRCIIAQILTRARKRTDRWIQLAVDQFDIPERVIQDSIGHDNSVLLSILIHLTRQAFLSRSWTRNLLWTFSQFDIHKTLPGLQHDFCALWNDIVLEARHEGRNYSRPLDALREIRHAYIDLHQGTHVTPTAFTASTGDLAHILYQPSSYPLCDIDNHRTDTPFRTPFSSIDTFHTPVSSIRSLVMANPGHATSFGDLNDASRTPLEGQPLPAASQDIATPVTQGNTDVSTTSVMTHPIHRPISRAGIAPQRSRIVSISPSVVSDSTPRPILLATLSSGIPGDRPLTSRSRSPSLSRTLAKRHVTYDIGSPSLIEMTRHPRPSTSADPTGSISENISRPEGHQHGRD